MSEGKYFMKKIADKSGNMNTSWNKISLRRSSW